MKKEISSWGKNTISGALIDAIKKLDPRSMSKNPGMLVLEVCAVFLTAKVLANAFEPPSESFAAIQLQITLWLWLSLLFANFAEAVLENRGRVGVDSIHKTKT